MVYGGYRDLKVYQLSYQLAMQLFERSKGFPIDEKYSLTDQVRRSSRSIAGNIAEAWKKRQYRKMFVSKLIDCAGEAGETEVWLDIAKDAGYLSQEEYQYFFEKYSEVSKMLSGMIDKAERFCFDN